MNNTAIAKKLKLCPICGFEGEFLEIRKKDKWHPHKELSCPQCLSAGRHRMIWLIYSELKKKEGGFSGRMLHCSPMKCLKEKFINDFIYISIDFPPRESESGVTRADLDQDLKNTSFQDNYFDIVICAAVLDDIKEADQAIKEIYRIIKPGGVAFITVPIFNGEKSKRMEEAELNNWWRCGLDFFQKYVNAGFEIEVIQSAHIEDYEKYGLTGDYLALCYKPSC